MSGASIAYVSVRRSRRSDGHEPTAAAVHAVDPQCPGAAEERHDREHRDDAPRDQRRDAPICLEPDASVVPGAIVCCAMTAHLLPVVRLLPRSCPRCGEGESGRFPTFRRHVVGTFGPTRRPRRARRWTRDPKGVTCNGVTAESADAVIGRDAELGAVTKFLDSAAAGSVALVIRGEPGIGKSTIWHAAVDRADAVIHRVVVSSELGGNESSLRRARRSLRHDR